MGENAKPKKKLAIVTCMDTRLVNFLSEKLGIAQGDAKVIKNAGNIITEDVIRSLVVAVYLLGVEDIMIIGHCKLTFVCFNCSTVSQIFTICVSNSKSN